MNDVLETRPAPDLLPHAHDPPPTG